MLILFLVAILFWNIYNENATSLTIWADSYTNRETPKPVEKLLKPFGFMETVNTKPKDVAIIDDQFRASTDANG